MNLAILAIDNLGNIGLDDNLPWSKSEIRKTEGFKLLRETDLDYYRYKLEFLCDVSLSKTNLIFGRRTFESLIYFKPKYNLIVELVENYDNINLVVFTTNNFKLDKEKFLSKGFSEETFNKINDIIKIKTFDNIELISNHANIFLGGKTVYEKFFDVFETVYLNVFDFSSISDYKVENGIKLDEDIIKKITHEKSSIDTEREIDNNKIYLKMYAYDKY